MQKPNINTFSPSLPEKTHSPKLPLLTPASKIAVIGAGAFGGWAASFLLQKKYHVTLIDAWGPGNSRASSGDETRVIRSTYGGNEIYFDLNIRALELWKEFEKRWQEKIFYNTGVLWLCHEENTPIVDDSIPFAKKHAVEYDYLSRGDLAKHYSLLETNDLHHAYYDPFGGYLKARKTCCHVNRSFTDAGGNYIQSYATPGPIRSGKMEYVILSDGSRLASDVYLFACGAWLGNLFPEVLGNVITCTKQEVYYFGVPYDVVNEYDTFPVWVDVDGTDFYYGIPGNSNRGFKIGVDKRGEKFDPTDGERTIDPTVLADAKRFIAHRFPALEHAPLLENRVCPYENSPDGNFIFDSHPEAGNVIFLGGGSGHGFKHGPALGELVSEVLSGRKKAPPLFSIQYSSK